MTYSTMPTSDTSNSLKEQGEFPPSTAHSTSLFGVLAKAGSEGGLAAVPEAGAPERLEQECRLLGAAQRTMSYYTPSNVSLDGQEVLSPTTTEELALADNRDELDADMDLFTFASNQRAEAAKVQVAGRALSGKTTVALRLAHLLNASYFNAPTILRGCTLAYLSDLHAAKQQVQTKAQQAREAALSAADGGNGTDAVDDAPVRAPADADDIPEDVDENQYLRLTPWTALGKLVYSHVSEQIDPDVQFKNVPALVQNNVDFSCIPRHVTAACLANAFADAWLHDESYVLDGHIDKAAVASALHQIGADAAACAEIVESAMVRLFVDATANKDEANAAPTDGNARPSTGKRLHSARSSHVRFAEGTLVKEVDTRGGKNIPKSKAETGEVASSAGAGDDTDKPVEYDHVAAALEAARLQLKTTQRLWHSRQKRAILQAALANLRRLALLADHAIVAAWLPQTILVLTLSDEEIAFRRAGRNTGEARIGLASSVALIRDLALPPPTEGDEEQVDPTPFNDVQLRKLADSDCALPLQLPTEAAPRTASQPVPTGMLVGRFFVKSASGLPAVIATVNRSDGGPAALEEDHPVESPPAAVFSSSGVPISASASCTYLNASQSVDDLMREALVALGGNSSVPFAGGVLTLRPARARWLKLPEELAVRPDATRGDDADEKQVDRHRYLLRENVPRVLRFPVVVGEIRVKRLPPVIEPVLPVVAIPPNEVPPNEVAADQSNEDAVDQSTAESVIAALESDSLLHISPPSSKSPEELAAEDQQAGVIEDKSDSPTAENTEAEPAATSAGGDECVREEDEMPSSTEAEDEGPSPTRTDSEAEALPPTGGESEANEAPPQTSVEDGEVDIADAGADVGENAEEEAPPPPPVKKVSRYDFSWSVTSQVFELAESAPHERAARSRPLSLAKSQAQFLASGGSDELSEEDPPKDFVFETLTSLADQEAGKLQGSSGTNPTFRFVVDRSAALGVSKSATSRRWSMFGIHCPVSLLDDGILVRGRLQFVAEYRGFIFAFADCYKLFTFLQRPRDYLHYPSNTKVDPCVMVCDPPGSTVLGKHAADTIKRLATQFGVPHVDMGQVIQRKVAVALLGGPSGTLASEVLAELQNGGLVHADLFARMVQSELARLRLAAVLEIEVNPEEWDRMVDPECLQRETALQVEDQALKQAIQDATQAIVEASAKKKLSAKKVDEAVAKEVEQLTTRFKAKAERRSQLHRLKQEHDSDDESDPVVDPEPVDAAASISNVARSFDIIAHRDDPSSHMFPISPQQIDSNSHRFRLHHVLTTVSPKLASYISKATYSAEFDEMTPTTAKDRILAAVFNLARVDIVTGCLVGAYQFAEEAKWLGATAFVEPSGAELGCPKLLCDDTLSGLALQCHASRQVDAGVLPPPLGLLGQDCTTSNYSLLHRAAHAQHAKLARQKLGWLVSGVPASLGVAKALTARGIVPTTFICLEPRASDGSELSNSEETDHNAASTVREGVIATLFDGIAPSDKLELSVVPWSAKTRTSLAAFAARLSMKIPAIEKFLGRRGVKVRRILCSEAPSHVDNVALSSTFPRMAVATTASELLHWCNQVMDPFALRADDMDDEFPDVDGDGETRALPWCGSFCPVALVDAHNCQKGRTDEGCKVKVRGQSVLCASQRSSLAVRCTPSKYLAVKDRASFPPRALVVAPKHTGLTTVLSILHARYPSIQIMVLEDLHRDAEALWRSQLPAPPAPAAEGEDGEANEVADAEAPVFPMTNVAEAIAGAVANFESQGLGVIMVAAGWFFKEDVLEELVKRNVLPSVLLSLEVQPEELVDATLKELQSAVVEKPAGEEEVVAPTVEDADAAITEQVALCEGLVAILETAGVPPLPKLRWHGLRNTQRLCQNLIQSLAPYLGVAPTTGDNFAPEDILSTAAIAPASMVLQLLACGEWRMSKFGGVCPVTLREARAAQKHAKPLASLAVPDLQNVDKLQQLTTASVDPESEVVPPTAQAVLFGGRHVPVFVVLGSVVYVCASKENALLFARNPRAYMSQAPAGIAPTTSCAVIDSSEAAAVAFGGALRAQLTLQVITPQTAVEYVLNRQADGSLSSNMLEVLQDGGCVNADVVDSCVVQQITSAESRINGFVLCGFPRSKAHLRMLSESQALPDTFIFVSRSEDEEEYTVEEVTRSRGRMIEPFRAAEEENILPDGERKTVDLAFSDDLAINGEVRRVSAPADHWEIPDLYTALQSNGVPTLLVKGSPRAPAWEAQVEIVKALERQQYDMAAFENNIRHGRVAPLRGVTLSPAQSGLAADAACPVAWTLKRHRICTRDIHQRARRSVFFRGRVYCMAGQENVAQFSSKPLPFVSAFPSISDAVSGSRILPHEGANVSASGCAYAAQCPVCLRAAVTNFQPSALSSGLLVRPGNIQCAVTVGDVKYACCSELHAEMFLLRPRYFQGLKPSSRPAVPRPQNAESTEFKQNLVRDLFERATASQDFTGFLESSAVPAIVSALKATEEVRDFLIDTKTAVVQPAVLKFIALHLKAFNAATKPHLRARHRKSLHDYVEDCSKAVAAVKAVPARRGEIEHKRPDSPQ
jgi:cytidylate kinase/adenylate kinase family enzyme